MHRFARLVALLAILLIALPVAAQDGLSEDEQANVDRLIDALDQVDAYTSYNETLTETNTTVQVLTASGEAREGAQTITTERVTRRAALEPDNLQANVTVLFENTDSGQEINNFSYTLNAEVRVVDGQLYVNATRDGGDEVGLPPVAEGWTLVEDTALFPELADLDLDSYMDDIAGLDDSSLFDEPDLLKEAATGVTVEEAELADGSPAERITLNIEGEGMILVLGSTSFGMNAEDEATAFLLENIDPASAVTVEVVLGEDGLLYERTANLDLVWSGLDLSQMSPDVPEGMATIDLALSFHISGSFTDINTEIALVEAPEM